MNRLFSNNKQEKGQGLVEYAIILSLVAIVVIGSMKLMGPKISCTFRGINNSLPGESGGSGDNCGTVNLDGEENNASTLTTEQSEVLAHVCSKYPGTSFSVNEDGQISSSHTGLNGGYEDRIPAGSYSCQ